MHALSNGDLGTSFLGDLQPAQTYDVEAGRKTWGSWWTEKKQRDEDLWRAAQSGCIEKLKAALAPPADGGPCAEVNSQALYGRTALHNAAGVGKRDCVELLLDAQAFVDRRTTGGLTALHIACQQGNLEVASLLLDRDADSCCEEDGGNVPLHLAAARGHTDVVTLLLERGCKGQLNVLNGLRQRPQEVAMDVEVANCFSEYLRSASDGSGENDSINGDRYAGRTPIGGSTVLLRNSRADVVRRLLQKSEQADKETSFAPAGDVVRPERITGPFARLVPESSSIAIEQVGPDTFDCVKVLGKGSFGKVFLVRHKATREEYAMKILETQSVRKDNMMHYALTERDVLTYLRHPYIVSLHYAFQTSKFLVLVLQFCSNGNLQCLINNQAILNRQKGLPENISCLYHAEIVLAIGHLHERDIVFRDLKPENVVLDAERHCMLTDFGLSKEGVEAMRGGRSFCGSIAFMAPEILKFSGHGKAVDIYGLGVMLFAMLSGLPPFFHRERETLKHNIMHARLLFPLSFSENATSLIAALMDREPSNRLGATDSAQVRAHPFFNPIDFLALMRREVPVPDLSSLATARRRSSPEPPVRSPFTRSGDGRSPNTWWPPLLGGRHKAEAGSGGGDANAAITSQVPEWLPFARLDEGNLLEHQALAGVETAMPRSVALVV
eukprot:TRINITY_DN3965_c0_g1_i4.p1 TRINITY_DN3965_c0_g1~~TRINITY_DN3965_c0_g1_i4.p1  ORF type:complete len:768 (-),score=135.08 TRINITY_DN3965_c0_g1_i4:45-2048(-)